MISGDSLSELRGLIASGFLLGMKVETESEGLPWQEISRLRVLSSRLELPFLIKIGGVEAITDMSLAANLDVDEIIAPMVETEFAASKFLEAVDENARNVAGRRLLIESATGIRNLSEIRNTTLGLISGLNFGRSDYSSSLAFEIGGYKKPDSFEVSKVISKAVLESKDFGLQTTMGGKITPESVTFISESFESLPDRLETRRFIFDTKMAIADRSLVFSLLKVELAMMSAFVAKNNSSALKTSVYVGELQSRLAGGTSKPFSI